MKNKTILFRADSSSTIGTGHIMRDLVLAQKYAKKGYKIIFGTQNLNGNINHKIKESSYKIEILKNNSFKSLQKVIDKYNPKLLVIDHYGIDEKKEKKIKTKNQDLKLLCFDDTYEKHHCDILLNHNISANPKKYKNLVPKSCKLKCGAKYTLLRDEFIKEKNKVYKINKKFTFFIAMGGADTANINVKILKVLKNFNNIKVNIVTTQANKNLEELKTYCKDKKWITLHINSTKIAKLIKKSDYGIITPSVTANELYFMKLPFLAIQTASNQEDIINYLKNKQYVVLDSFIKNTLLFELNLIINKIELINFTKLSNKQNIQVLKMRNSNNIRKWMYNKNKIKFEDHLNYIKSLENKDSRLYFLVKQDNENIGVINFTNITNNKAELGIYANPSLKGQGTFLLKIIIDYGFNVLKLKVLKANVFINNLKAINLYKRFGFKIISKDNDLIYMELKNENR